MCNEVENLFERYNEAKKELEYHKKEAERLEEEVERHNEAKRELEYHKKEAERLEEEVEYLEQEIHEMQDGFSKSAGKKTDEKDERIEELERTVERYKEMVGYYYTTLANLVDDKKELMEKVNEQAELIKKLENEINSYKEFMRENEELRRQVDGWKGLARENEVKSVEYCKRLEDKNKLIDYMCNKNDEFEMYVDKLNRDIAQKDEQIEKLNKELAIARVGSQTRMSRMYAIFKMYVDKLNRDIAQKDEQIEKLNKELAISRDEALKAINEAIKKLNEEN